ncbi:MAG: LamG-like jellyroll fold domain-containing protein [Luteolibacter sp.]
MEISDIDLLITRVLEGDAAPAEVAALEAACGKDAALGRRFAREVALHRLTGSVIGGADGESRFAAEVVARIQSSPTDQTEDVPTPIQLHVERRLRRTILFSRVTRSLAVAAVLVLAVGLTIFMNSRDGATFTRSESIVWAGNKISAGEGDRLKEGRVLEIASGLAELKFSAGVVVLLEGPARFEITGPKSARLDHGRLVARVTDVQGRGFVIDGPSGRVVDLGTEFGVNVERSGEMEVHVLEGTVTAASHQREESVVTLHQHEAVRLGAGPSQRMPADDGVFITDLPPVPGRVPGFIRWSFEETDGVDLRNSGKGLAETEAGARLLSGRDGGETARRVDGRFGKALTFDGISNFAESGYEGISGQAPRTVSLWARIPADLTVTQSYAMIGWGKVEGSGSAWQISINPAPDEGPLGALRVGTGRGAVVGTTDLRDGKWHHLTAVMYGGSPTTATHVLLYVDGMLEPTTRKSVRTINTLPATEFHGVWMGRNLSRSNPDPPGASFFRGDLDEVHIFAAALDHPMILQVMGGASPEF